MSTKVFKNPTMKLSVLLLFLSTSLSSFSQNDEFMVWTGVGVRGDIIKKTDWVLDLNTRFDNEGVATLFPQVGVEFKPFKWLKTSLEYRLLVDKNKYGNYKSSNRLNFNLSGKTSVHRFSLGVRLRYQYGFTSLSASDTYDADFDQAFRFKPSVSYDIKKSIFVPIMSAEFFYNPSLGKDGRQFSKVRLAVGTKLDFKGPHGASIKYQLDKKLHNYEAGVRHVISIGYEYKL